VVLVSAACQKKEEQASTNPPASSPAAQPAAPAASTPAPAAAPSPSKAIASAEYSADPAVRCDLLEVKRVSGGAVLIRWRIVNTAGGQQPGSLAAAQPKPAYYNFDWPELYYTDPVENKKYAFLTDSEGKRILDVYWGNLAPGEQRGNWAKFPAPPAGSDKITVYIPKFPPFEDVPVGQ
jgi:hypothetical protein